MKKGRYQIRIEGGALLEVDATEFWVFGYGPLIVHRDRYYPNMWTCSEPRGGAMIFPKAKTRKEAMEKGTEWVLTNTPERYQELVTSTVKINPLKTRFEEEEYSDEQQSVGA